MSFGSNVSQYPSPVTHESHPRSPPSPPLVELICNPHADKEPDYPNVLFTPTQPQSETLPTENDSVNFTASTLSVNFHPQSLGVIAHESECDESLSEPPDDTIVELIESFEDFENLKKSLDENVWRDPDVQPQGVH